MIISIDYDNTYTADIGLWCDFIDMAQGQGHEVVCITNREKPPEPPEPVPPVPIFCAHEMYKGAKAAEDLIMVDIWIDDLPGTVEPGRWEEVHHGTA